MKGQTCEAGCTALIVEDTRRDYDEKRYQALGMIGENLHMLVFTPRDGAAHDHKSVIFRGDARFR